MWSKEGFVLLLFQELLAPEFIGLEAYLIGKKALKTAFGAVFKRFQVNYPEIVSSHLNDRAFSGQKCRLDHLA